MTDTCPQGHQSSHRRLLRRVRRPHRAAPPRRRPAAAARPAQRRPRRVAHAAGPAGRRRVSRARTAATENPADALFCEECGYDFTTGQLPTPAGDAVPRPAPSGSPSSGSTRSGSSTRTSGGCATSGAPTVVPLRATTVTVGPRVQEPGPGARLDCSNDGAVSHEHAQLSLDHDRWYVEDLGSTNGTFVGAPGRTAADNAAAAAPAARARRRRADLRRRLDPHHGPPRHRQREGRRRHLTQNLSDASVRTVRSLSASSSSSASPATSGGASWTTGSPRSSARQMRPGS